MPSVYQSPYNTFNTTDRTPYQAFVGRGTVFEPGVRISASSISDGFSNTAMFGFHSSQVEWTKPADINYNPSMSPYLFGYNDTIVFGMCDGSVRVAKKSNLTPALIKQIVVRNDGSILPDIWD